MPEALSPQSSPQLRALSTDLPISSLDDKKDFPKESEIVVGNVFYPTVEETIDEAAKKVSVGFADFFTGAEQRLKLKFLLGISLATISGFVQLYGSLLMVRILYGLLPVDTGKGTFIWGEGNVEHLPVMPYGYWKVRIGEQLWDLLSGTFGRYLICFFIVATLGTWYNTILRQIGEDRALYFRINYFRAILQMEMGWFDKEDPLILPTRLAEDIISLKEVLGEKFAQVASGGTTLVAGLSFALYNAPHLFFVWLVMMGFIGGGFYLYLNVDAGSQAKQAGKYERAGAVAEETFSNARTVQACNAQAQESSRYNKYLNSARKDQIKTGVLKALGFTMIFMGFQFGIASIFLIYQKFILPKIDLVKAADSMESFQYGLMGIILSVSSIFSVIPFSESYGKGKAALAKFLLVTERAKNLPLKNGSKLLEADDVDLEMRNVYFRYPTRPKVPVLSNLSFTCKSGERIALVGASGSGKSTVLQLIDRLYDVNAGYIWVNGTDIKEYDIDSLRTSIGWVSQEPVLYEGTIQENILLGLERNVTEEEIRAVCRIAMIDQFIQDLPDKLNTSITGSSQLSGGQKQRIAIARALIRRPKILVLDEATSALDYQSERAVQQTINKVCEETKMTVIIVAHRLSTVRSCDTIYFLEDGQIVEQGNYGELVKLNGRFAALARTQEIKSVIDQKESTTDDEAAVLKAMQEEDAKLTKKLLSVKKEGEEEGKNEEEAKDEYIVPDEFKTEEMLEKERQEKILATYSTPWRRLYELNTTRDKCLLFVVLIACVGVGGSQPFQTWATMQPLMNFFDFEKIQNLDNNMSEQTTTMFLIAGINAICVLTSQSLTSYIGAGLSWRLRSLLFDKLLNQDMEFFDQEENSTGRLNATLAKGARDITPLTGPVITIILQLMTMICVAVGLSLYVYWKFALAFAGVFAATLLIVLCLVFFLIGSAKADKPALQRAGHYASESIRNIRAVRSVQGAEKMFLEKFKKQSKVHHEDMGPENFKYSIGVGAGVAFFTLLLPIVNFTVVYLFCRTVLNANPQEYSLEQGPQSWKGLKEYFQIAKKSVLALMILNNIMGDLIRNVIMFPDWAKARTAAHDIFGILDSKISVEIKDGNVMVESIEKIEFQDVHFRYSTRQDVEVLKGINLIFDKGESVAFCGPSGSGKSTILALLARFYDPNTLTIDDTKIENDDETGGLLEAGNLENKEVLLRAKEAHKKDCITKTGQIAINGRYSLHEDINLRAWRAGIGYVGQEPVLFDLSVKENILYGLTETQKSAITEERFQEVAQMASIEFVSDTDPNKISWSEKVGSKGQKLSGGQKQRVAIARALIRNPRILLLDEATSALDGKSEREVQIALDKLLATRKGGMFEDLIVVTIAHRVSTIQNYDKICVCEGGRIVQSGSHNTLMQDTDGLYAALCRTANGV